MSGLLLGRYELEQSAIKRTMQLYQRTRNIDGEITCMNKQGDRNALTWARVHHDGKGASRSERESKCESKWCVCSRKTECVSVLNDEWNAAVLLCNVRLHTYGVTRSLSTQMLINAHTNSGTDISAQTDKRTDSHTPDVLSIKHIQYDIVIVGGSVLRCYESVCSSLAADIQEHTGVQHDGKHQLPQGSMALTVKQGRYGQIQWIQRMSNEQRKAKALFSMMKEECASQHHIRSTHAMVEREYNRPKATSDAGCVHDEEWVPMKNTFN